MSIIRVAKRSRWTAVSRETINDEKLSFRARGILHWLLDKPDDWECRATAIAAASDQEGRDAIRKALSELEEHGYLVRTKRRGDKGRFFTETVVYERPVEGATTDPDGDESAGQGQDGFPGPGEPDVGEPDVGDPGPIPKTETEDGNSARAPGGAAPKRGTKAQRDAAWDALVAVFGPASTRSRRKMYGQVVTDLMGIPGSISQAEIVRRARRCVARFDGASPMALTKHWDALGEDATRNDEHWSEAL